MTTPLSPAPLDGVIQGPDKEFTAAWKRWIDELQRNVRTLATPAPSPPAPAPPATSPGGVNTYVQFNDSGTFGGSAGFTYNKATNTLTVSKAVINNLDNSVIGAVTPAAGTFTTLNATTLGFTENSSLVLAQRSFFRPAPTPVGVAGTPAVVVVDDSSLVIAQRALSRSTSSGTAAASAPAVVVVDDASLVIAQKAMTRPAPPPPIVTADSQQILPTQIFGA